MKLKIVWDDAQITDHAYNVYLCENCGMIVKEDVWEDEGELWIKLDNSTIRFSYGDVIIERN
jgi:hypothetical protein